MNRQVGGFSSDGVADPEVTSSAVEAVVFYLGPSRRRPAVAPTRPRSRLAPSCSPAFGCAKCHLPVLRTGPSTIAALSNVEFHPYTDLLLHDMGPDLDDGYTEGRALTSEWRTAPLWGIGLAESSQGGMGFFLHDGRARTLTEAIDFHGGEARRESNRVPRPAAGPARSRCSTYLRSL